MVVAVARFVPAPIAITLRFVAITAGTRRAERESERPTQYRHDEGGAHRAAVGASPGTLE